MNHIHLMSLARDEEDDLGIDDDVDENDDSVDGTADDEFDEGGFLTPQGSGPDDAVDDEDDADADDVDEWEDNPFDGPANPEY